MKAALYEGEEGTKGWDRRIRQFLKQTIVDGDPVIARHLTENAKIKDYKSEDVIYNQDDTLELLFFCFHGCVRLIDKTGDLDTREPGTDFGGWPLVHPDDFPGYAVTAIARDQSVVAAVPFAALRRLPSEKLKFLKDGINSKNAKFVYEGNLKRAKQNAEIEKQNAEIKRLKAQLEKTTEKTELPSIPSTIDFGQANGRQLGLILTTFVAIFVRRGRLTMFLSEQFDINFDSIAQGDDFREEVFNLLRDAQAEGWLAELVTKALRAYERSRASKKMIDQWFLFADSSETSAAAVPDLAPSASTTDRPAPTPATLRASEGTKRGPRPAVTNPSEIEYVMSELRDPKEAQRWLDQLAAIRRRVCRVAIDSDRGSGTGFLIGPDLVLTANFVASPANNTSLRASHVNFDFEIVDGQIKQANRIAVSEIILGPDGEKVDLDCLTYAILRLGSREGESLVDGAARGWFDLNNARAEFHPEEVLFLLHCPLAGPLHLSEGKLIAADFPYRLRYEGDTAGGSSGAPIFDRNFRLVGIHERRLAGIHEQRLGVGYKLGLRADSIAVALRAQGCLPPSWTGDVQTGDVQLE